MSRARVVDIRSARSAGQGPHEGSEVRAVVGTSYDKIRNREVGKIWEHIIESHECASCRCTVVVPDLAVLGITANLHSPVQLTCLSPMIDHRHLQMARPWG